MLYCMSGVSASDAEDIRIVEDVRTGRTASFRDIVERYNRSILKICYSQLGSREEAEDASQEIFMRAYRSLSAFRSDKRFWTWLYSITMNHLRTHYSKLKRQEVLKERAGRNLQFYKNDPLDLFLKQEMRQKIQTAVALLPANLKEVVTLYYIEDMGVSDISRALGLTRENVKIKLYRARNRLKESLEHMAF